MQPNLCYFSRLKPLNAELNTICYLPALLGAYHFLHVSRIRVKSLTIRLLMSYIYIYIYIYIYMEHLFLMFLDHTQRGTTVGRTLLDKCKARRRDLYVTTHNTHNRTNFHAPSGIRTHNLSRRVAADLRLRWCGYWERQRLMILILILVISCVHEIYTPF